MRDNPVISYAEAVSRVQRTPGGADAVALVRQCFGDQVETTGVDRKALEAALADNFAVIDWRQAADLVRQALYGDDCLPELTLAQQDLAGLRLLEAAARRRVREWEQMVARREDIERQFARADRWLRERGIEPVGGSACRARVRLAVAAAFPSRPFEATAERSTAAEARAWVAPIVERIAAAGKQLRRKDFDAMVRVDFRLADKALDRLWTEVTPETWRKAAQGTPRKGRMVDDWRSWVPARAHPHK